MAFKCPKGFDKCLKTCSTENCRETCEYAEECCTKYCIFEQDSILSKVQQGDEEAFKSAMSVILGDEGTERANEMCCSCGRSVTFGSGWFVNRIPDFNPPEVRAEMGRAHPEGDFLCAECDDGGRTEEVD